MAKFKTLDDLPEDLTGKRVLVRVDLNVPMDGAKVTDDTRLRAMLPTVLELSDRHAIVLLLSHFGRPKGEVRPDMSTAQLVLPVHRLAGRSVRFIEDCQGPQTERAIATMLPGNIGILENTRFHAGEEKNDPELAKHFAPLAKALAENEDAIVGELAAVQGKPVDIGGYYAADREKTAAVMRPSQTFNETLAAADARSN